MGVTLAIDDFGMGYSSLSYLKRFPFDRLKIDQSFVRDVISDPDDAAITRTIIAIAHSLGMAVIAEGVETESALAYLRRHGCHEIQGYLISPPLPPAEFEKLLRSSLPGPLYLTTEGPQPETLLIVDDDVSALRSMERSLRHEHYQVLTTTSVATAFELMAMHTIQVLIVDHRMPEMGGIDFLVRVKEMYPDTVRIILTGYPEPATITDAINRGGIYRFLTKPLDDSVLRHEVTDAFELFRSKTGAA
jgi:CheY-like chemotaxis protein